MQLPRFEYFLPRDLEDALSFLEKHGKDCAVLAGGTDLLVRMKQRLLTPRYLLSLKPLESLSFMREGNGALKIGSGTTISKIAGSDLVEKYFPSLAEAMDSIGAPSIQHFRGTIGGNLCQENRCLFYNKSEFWRKSRQACHKAGGKICYALEGSDRCRSINQSDGAPILIALEASVTLQRKDGSRTIPLLDLYSSRGEEPLSMEPGELLTEISIPLPDRETKSAYKRVAFRSAIDYPLVSAGVCLKTRNREITQARIVVGAVGNAPLLFAQASESLAGKSVADSLAVEKAAALAMDHASVFAANNVNAPLEYRINMISVMVRRALQDSLKEFF